jgi:hypothetical protein
MKQVMQYSLVLYLCTVGLRQTCLDNPKAIKLHGLAEREDQSPSSKEELLEFLRFLDEHTAEINAVSLAFIKQILLRHTVNGPVNWTQSILLLTPVNCI